MEPAKQYLYGYLVFCTKVALPKVNVALLDVSDAQPGATVAQAS